MFEKGLPFLKAYDIIFSNKCSKSGENMDTIAMMEKLRILTDAAKYDVACTSSGVDRKGGAKGIGNAVAPGICHCFSTDGRCISLLKILFTNECIYDCKYCMNGYSNDVERASFTPQEVAELTIDFYRRNYIEGLFLSSGIKNNPTYTMEHIYQAVRLLREQYHFNGYIHVKAIPGADPYVIEKTGWLVDRMSVNLELPTAEGLKQLAPNKTRKTILTPMKQIQLQRNHSKLLLSDKAGTKEVEDIGQRRKNEAVPYKESLLPSKYTSKKVFVPAGQSSQMIVGATKESDYEMLKVAEALYQNFDVKRVFYSAFVNTTNHSMLPVLKDGPPLLREHRLYQADWLLRFYGFKAEEILSKQHPDFNVFLDPKCNWALNHFEQFPIEINKAGYYQLLRIPGIGVNSARRIMAARRIKKLDFDDIKKFGVVLKRAKYFILCNGKRFLGLHMTAESVLEDMLEQNQLDVWKNSGKDEFYHQMSLFEYKDFNFIK